ncbi:MAG: hypothetical protein P8J59_07740 [Phycisphaerales bacterium]|jgi:hypothetical protein|nr:hypothetical protein [Phycisphaerales bacterium]
MSTKAEIRRIDTLLEETEGAMKEASWYAAERHAVAALDLAIEAGDHELAARACLPLQEARRQRGLDAIDAANGTVVMLDHIPAEIESVDPGVFLLYPNAVGADARRLRIAALQFEVPIFVVCREPDTRLGLVPVVALGGTTVRARIDPPEDPDDPTLEWVINAMEQLGDAAIDGLDPGLSGSQRIDALRSMLDSVPDHERLHQALADALRAAAG